LSKNSTYSLVKNFGSKQNLKPRFVNSKLAKLIDSLRRKLIGIAQLGIVDADMVLEVSRLRLIRQINNQTDMTEHYLFLTSLWLDKRRFG